MSRSYRRIIDAGFVLIGFASLGAAAVGLPLYGDGALYFLEIILESAPLVPNGRYSAVLAQLPVVVATAITDQITPLRLAFSLGYGLLPFLSLLACWLIARRRAPALILYPALFLVANQINFSSVSELLMGLYLAWPFLLLAALNPGGKTTGIVGLALAVALFFLHPLASILLIALGFIGLVIRKANDSAAKGWSWLSAIFMTLGLLRLCLSAIGANAYERSYLGKDEALGYVFPNSTMQTLLVLSTLLLGILIAFRHTRLSTIDMGKVAAVGSFCAAGAARDLPSRRLISSPAVLWPIAGLIFLFGFLVAAQIWAGEGIKLKSALVFPVALILMVLALFDAGQPSSDEHERSWVWCFLLLAITITLISISKTAAWSRATSELAAAMGESSQTCVRFGPNEPPALQFPRMRILDNWTAPMNTLIFRAGQPVKLLLPGNGCRELENTGIAHLTTWFGRPLRLLQQRFGPPEVWGSNSNG